jgi:thioredoxin-dependent peroxiredoxin
MGVERSTFVIDGAGVLRHAWRKVKVKGHAEAVLAAVKSL